MGLSRRRCGAVEPGSGPRPYSRTHSGKQLDNEGLGEVLAVVGLDNQMNKLADAYQVEPNILPRVP
jgi:hypothetical protein